MAQRIGEFLVARGVVRPADLDVALESARLHGGRVASELLALGIADEAPIIEALAMLLGVPGVDLSRSALDLKHLDLVPREVAEAEFILPLERQGQNLLLAMADPQKSSVVDEVRLVSGLDVVPHVALHASLEEAIPAAYDAHAAGKPLWKGRQLPGDVPRAQLAIFSGLPEAPPVGDDGIVIEVDEGAEEAEEEVLASVRARPGPPLVLVVDDEEEILVLVGKALASRGWRVETARRGKEALLRIGELLPDCVLLDANLPEIHGFDICRKIKSNRRYARIPVLMMTAVYRGWRFAEDIRETYGADDFIEKPFLLEDLLRRVEVHLQRSTGEPEPGRPEAEELYAAGVQRLREGRMAEAIDALEKAVAADPFSPRVHYALARALQAAGEPYRALSAYERTVELDPGHFAALKSLAALYQQKGFRRKAIEAWERAIPAAPDDDTRTRIKTGLLALL